MRPSTPLDLWADPFHDTGAGLTIVIRDPHLTEPLSRHSLRPGYLELTPDQAWTWDSDEWLGRAQECVETAGVAGDERGSGAVVVIAEAGAIPFGVSLSTTRVGVDVLLLFPRSVGKDFPPENALSVIEAGSGEPLIVAGYERSQSGVNGPRNDGWLKLFGRSRLARFSHFDYLPVHPPGTTPLRDPRVVTQLVFKALTLKASLGALRTIKDAGGAPVPVETLDRAQTTYQGMVVLAMHRLRAAGGSPDWILDKLESKEWAVRHGFPVARLRDVVRNPSELRLDHFDPYGVVKPVMGSSSMGVKILHSSGASLVSFGSSRVLKIEELQRMESDALRRLTPEASARGLMIEDPVLDATGDLARVDYKFFFSGDDPVLAMMVERRNGGIFCHWTDTQGRIMHPNPVWTNTFYRHVVEMPRPEAWDELLAMATDIYRATGFDFTRIDMYLGADGPVFGEVTPSPGNFFYGNGDKLALSTSLNIAQRVHTASRSEESH